MKFGKGGTIALYYLLAVSLIVLTIFLIKNNNVISWSSFTNMTTTQKPTISGFANPLPLATLYYQPTCPHCISMKPAWDEVSKRLAGKVSMVNGSEQPDVARAKGITGYPTLIRNKDGVKYAGDRTADDMYKFITA